MQPKRKDPESERLDLASNDCRHETGPGPVSAFRPDPGHPEPEKLLAAKLLLPHLVRRSWLEPERKVMVKRKEIKFRCDEKTEMKLAKIAAENGISEYALVNLIVTGYLNGITKSEKKRIVEMVSEAEKNILQCLRVLNRLEFMNDEEKRRFGASCITRRLIENAKLMNRVYTRICGGKNDE